MDTSKEYREMCEKAEEIQELWKPTVLDRVFTKSQYVPNRDYVAYVTNTNGYTVHLDIDVSFEIIHKGNAIWLPRQDQLQEMMLPKDCGALWIMFGAFFCKEKTLGKSFEQLWLAFVMKEKYGKIWNGGDWIKK